MIGSVLAIDLHHQTLLEGVCFGFGYGLLAVGFVLLYRASRVINLAYAQVGAFASALLVLLVGRYSWNYWPAAAVALAVGCAIGALIELTVIRRLSKAPKVVILVATAGVAQLLLAAEAALPRLPPTIRRFPSPFEWSGTLGEATVRGDHLIALVTAPLAVIALAWFLRRSIWGAAIRGAADNRDAARLAGIPAGAMTTIVWAIGGVLATVTQLSTRPLLGTGAIASVALDARTLVVAMAAATVARLHSLPRAMVAGVVLGVIQRILLLNYPTQTGLFDIVLLGVILVAILSWRRRPDVEDGREWMFVPADPPVPPQLSSRWWARHAGLIGWCVAACAAIVLPLLVTETSRQFLYTRIVVIAVLAVTVTMLTGWAGQLSLGQFAFAGIGAFVALRLASEGMAFIPALALGALAAGAVAILVGLPALRVQGLLLAVITLAFALVASGDLFGRILGDGFARLERAGTSPIDLGPQRTYYWFCLAILGLVIITATRVRGRGVGRSLVAMRSNEPNAAALAISPAREKLIAFAIAGTLAGLAGALLAANAPAGVSASDEQFLPIMSIQVVAIAVIGGLTSVRGAVLGAVWVVGLPAFFPGSSAAPLLASGVGLLVVLMYFPGGLSQVVGAVRAAVLGYLGRGATAPPAAVRPIIRIRPAEVLGDPAAPALEVSGVSVAFGGNQAVDDVSIIVPRGEIVGLIGSNGAGKSTLVNAIGGFVSSSGTVRLHGQEINGWSTARRSAAGLGRGFQAASLFPELEVREVIQVALERRRRTSWAATLTGWPTGIRHERALVSEADDIIDVVGLGRYAHHRVGELSTGTRRIVELGTLIAHGGSVLCLDEPTGGVAQRETEAFGPLLVDLRRQLDATMVIIEHDIPLISSISDRVYCLEAGQVIASGAPDTVRNDPLVVASYLGTDDRAIRRSDSEREVPSHAPGTTASI